MRRAARAFVEAGLAPVFVVVSPDPRLREALAGMPLDLVVNRHPERGIGHSIGLGVQALPAGAAAAVIGVADQPRLSAALIQELLAAFRPGAIVAPRYGRHPGNPRVYDRRFWPELARLRGDVGAQGIARRYPDALIEVKLRAELGVDVDTTEDLSRLGS